MHLDRLHEQTISTEEIDENRNKIKINKVRGRPPQGYAIFFMKIRCNILSPI